MTAKSPLKSLAGQTVVYGMGTIVPRLLNYMLVPIYTRVFEDQATYGQVTELYAYIAFLMVLLTYGMETAFFRFAQKNDPQKVFYNAMSAIIISTVVFLAGVCLFYKTLASWMQYDGNSEYILIVAFIVAFDAVSAIPFAMLRKLNKARKFAMIRLINVLITILLNFITILIFPQFFTTLATQFFGDESSLVAWVLISNLLASFLSLMMLGKILKSFKWSFEQNYLLPMLRYAWPVLIIGLAGMVNEMLDKILLKYLLDPGDQPMVQLGIYGANYKLGVLMTLFIQMFRYAAEPFFFAEAEKKDAPELFARVMNFFVISGIIIFLGVSLYMDIFKHLIGEKYRDGLSIVPIVLIANLLNGVYYNLAIWYKLTDKTLSGAYIAMGGALITIVLNFLLIPVFGYVGAAWTHLVTYFLMMVVSYFWGQKVFWIPYNVSRIGGYFALGIGLFAVSILLPEMHMALKLLIHTLLFLIFIFSVSFIEKIDLNPSKILKILKRS
ncbi:MAG: polysaccharide biosynthesis protein [Bacteroidetes bacterium]|nr:MAG: polysaccharide biosynthesis protein [Bacteroidota bacterium]